MFYFALFCVEPYLMRLAVTMFILGVGTSPGGKTRVNKSNTRNTGVAGISYNMAPLPGSIGRRSTISYDQAKTASSSTERTNDVPKYVHQFITFFSLHFFPWVFRWRQVWKKQRSFTLHEQLPVIIAKLVETCNSWHA